MSEEKQSYLLLEDKKEAYLVYLSAILISFLSLLLLIPLGYWIVSSYFIPRKYIDNRQLKYTGILSRCFIIFYIGVILMAAWVVIYELLLKQNGLINSIPHQLLNAVPGVIASLCISVQLNRYNQKNTHFADENDGKSGFIFYLALLVGKHILAKIISAISVGLLYPITTRISTYADYERGYIDGYRCDYEFTLKKMYPRYLLDLLLSIVTIGFYYPMLVIRRMEIDQQFVHILPKKNTSSN